MIATYSLFWSHGLGNIRVPHRHGRNERSMREHVLKNFPGALASAERALQLDSCPPPSLVARIERLSRRTERVWNQQKPKISESIE